MAKKFFVEGGKKLEGKVKISGSKNSALPILTATLLSKEPSVIEGIPQISDIFDLLNIFKAMGVKFEFLNSKIKVYPQNFDYEKAPVEIFERIRASVLLLAPFLQRFDKFKIPHPGGDKIGLRPITSHLKMIEDFGVKFKIKGNFYFFEKTKLPKKRKIVLEEFSVTATENALMIAASHPGKTRIEMAACEPHVQDLAKFLVKMGAKIKGIGTHTLEIEGTKKLSGSNFKISPDPVETGTFFIALALCGEGEIENTQPEHLTFFFKKAKEIGIKFEIKKNKIFVYRSKKFFPTKIQCLPHPGFPTDLQPQISVLLTQAKGKSLIHEPLYENRFSHLHQLRKMGADIEITDPHRALIFGKTPLFSTKLDASDIRSGAALVLAALIAKGESKIENIEQIDRGYEKFDEKLRSLGASIKRVE